MDNFEDLLGKTLTNIEVVNYDEEIIFTCDDGSIYKMYHRQDCCETVTIDDIDGCIYDLIGSPIELADKSTNSKDGDDENNDSCTWTFYRLATIDLYISIKWYGTSNGYYSESVDFEKIN